MNPTARLLGTDLVLTRTFRAPADDVWASLTESDRTARWFGPWEGTPEPGHTIKVQMAYEEEAPWTEMRIEACEAPRRLELLMTGWQIVITLTETDGTTELVFTQHLAGTEGIGDIGPGWEYYLDMLVAARDGAPKPKWDDYYPAQKAYFEALP
jgi:uncharacterized protein YndB with AHSA1/START domain